ncbi:ketoacyl-ACP synthase III [Actinospica durhamensis]|uniref:Ketoacyl-ACP synthase III n=1 Tax=Actinospica durhamensis TaxID=1508375 RepID=A0A941IQG2_9ACTN|nr:ketoacyl-ACP synthase III [Actinospica durhamensis]MBR7837615.1 ketoacyl-ACP synthase III [Actinospica durhamensis]
MMDQSTARPPYGVGVRSIGAGLPARVVTNAELEGPLRTTDAWITKRIGVRERRWAAEGEHTSHLGARALLDACDRAGISPETLDLVVCGTYTPDQMAPAAAVAVMRNLGLSGIPGFDVNSGGCAGGVFALDVGARYIAAGLYRRVAVVLADTNTRVLDPADRITQVIFGDGAACYLLEPTVPGVGLGDALMRSEPGGYQIAGVRRESRTSEDGVARKTGYGENFAYMDGAGVWNFAVDNVPGFVEELVKAEDLALEDVDLVVFHQANARLIEELGRRLSLREDQMVCVVDKYGNTSGAGLALALREAQAQGRLNPGSVVALVAFGAGMSYGGSVIRWPDASDFLHPAAGGAADASDPAGP